jgi:DnaJ-class molecular chaperone
MRDPYAVLGVPRTASESEIKKAFRREAKKVHPDTHPDDPKAKEKFAEVNAAYEIVGDADKRRKFDSGEIGPDGKPRFTGFEGFAGGESGFRRQGGFSGQSGADARAAEDILNDIFGDAFAQFATGPGGARSRRRATSADFGSAGAGPGAGAGPQAAVRGADVIVTARVKVEDIVGSGKTRVTLPNGKVLDVKIPPGFEPGQQVRLKGQGGEGPVRGDAIVILVHEPHALFRVDGTHLRLDLPVSLDEAVLGAKVRVPTPDGAVDLTIPAGITAAKAMRIRGKGLVDKTGGRGDLLVTPRIVMPEAPDAGLEQLMKRLREMHPYSPRGPEFG